MFPSGASSGQEHLSCSSRAFVCREAEVEGFDQLGILKANIFKMEVEKTNANITGWWFGT